MRSPPQRAPGGFHRLVRLGWRVAGAWLLVPPALAAGLPPPPQLGSVGRADFEAYLAADEHKAFAIAPGGAWGWVAERDRGEDALAEALTRCRAHTEQPCVPYAVDARRRFDELGWANLWRLRPADKTTSATAATGLGRGATFPDLVFASAEGSPKRLSEWRGKVVVLHFWGSWCAPCRHELPDLAAQAKVFARVGVRLIPLQVRESFAESRGWLARQGIALELYDSGIKSRDDGALRVAGGGSLPDRAVAPVFPSTVVLDKSGRVVFSHHGPIERWADYLPQLKALGR